MNEYRALLARFLDGDLHVYAADVVAAFLKATSPQAVDVVAAQREAECIERCLLTQFIFNECPHDGDMPLSVESV